MYTVPVGEDHGAGLRCDLRPPLTVSIPEQLQRHSIILVYTCVCLPMLYATINGLELHCFE